MGTNTYAEVIVDYGYAQDSEIADIAYMNDKFLVTGATFTLSLPAEIAKIAPNGTMTDCVFGEIVRLTSNDSDTIHITESLADGGTVTTILPRNIVAELFVSDTVHSVIGR